MTVESSRRTGVGDAGLLATLVVLAVGGLGAGGWLLSVSSQDDRDAERRWAMPGEAKAVAEEVIALTPPRAGALAEDDVKAAAARYEEMVAAIRAEHPSDAERLLEGARARYRCEMDVANDKAERLAKELDDRTAERREQLRRKARDLVAEWEELFARHPEWPPHRLEVPE